MKVKKESVMSMLSNWVKKEIKGECSNWVFVSWVTVFKSEEQVKQKEGKWLKEVGTSCKVLSNCW